MLWRQDRDVYFIRYKTKSIVWFKGFICQCVNCKTFAQNAKAATKKLRGKTTRDTTSIFRVSEFLILSDLVPGLFLIIRMDRMMAYSEVATKMNIIHKSIHLTRAVDPSSVWGAFSLTKFRVFNAQRHKVTNRPKRPGTAFGGIRKLIWKMFCN